MLNEWQEFLEYTGPVTYKADSKKIPPGWGALHSRPCGTLAGCPES